MFQKVEGEGEGTYDGHFVPDYLDFRSTEVF